MLLHRKKDDWEGRDILSRLSFLYMALLVPVVVRIFQYFIKPLTKAKLVWIVIVVAVLILSSFYFYVFLYTGKYVNVQRCILMVVFTGLVVYIGRVFLPVDCDEEELLPLLYEENLFLMKGEEDSEVEADGMIKEVVSQLEGLNELEKQAKERELVRVVGESLHGYTMQGEQRLYTIAPQGTSVSLEELYWLEEKGLKQLQETPILIYKWLKERVGTQVERFTIYEIVLAKGEQSQWYEGRMMLEKKRWDQSEFAHLLAHPSSIKVIVLLHKEHWSMPKAVGTLYRSL